MLRELKVVDTGPFRALDMALAPRLNVLAGDNGLGKSFVLELIWRGLSGTVYEPGIVPHPQATEWKESGLKGGLTSSIQYRFQSGWTQAAVYVSHLQTWGGMSTMPSSALRATDAHPSNGVILSLSVDGTVNVWDELRNKKITPARDADDRPSAFSFTPDEVWEGQREQDRVICRGLLEDWLTWQQTRSPEFDQLCAALETLSGGGGPEEASRPRIERLLPGEPEPSPTGEARFVPTLKLPYGQISLTHASAGMKRICALAYMLVWAWSWHRNAARLQRREPSRALTVLIDEVEAHLHPEWQRRILPALLRVAGRLAGSDDVQIVVSTHAPLVLASLEPEFDPERDALWTFDLEGDEISVQRAAWRRRGSVSNWLTSEVFDLGLDRSVPAQEAIRMAREALNRPDLSLEEAREIHRRLHSTLGDTDPLWARWEHIARARGLEP